MKHKENKQNYPCWDSIISLGELNDEDKISLLLSNRE